MASLELECKMVRKLAVQNGTSARGPWSKQEFIVEYQEGNYPSQICMNVWGADKVKDLEGFQPGETVKVSFNLSSREYNGRWYTDVRAWRMEHASAAAPAQAQQFPSAPVPSAPMPSAEDYSNAAEEDDLPF